MSDQKNMIIAFVLSALVLAGYYFVQERFFPPPPRATTAASTTKGGAQIDNGQGGAQVASGLPSAPQAAATKPRPEALAESKRIPLRSDLLSGSIALTGGRLDDLTLTRYHETVDPNSPLIDLLNPPDADDAYYADFGWLAPEGSSLRLPGKDTSWTASEGALGPDHPVVLSWDNGQGLVFTRTIAVDRDYMFTVTDAVKNGGSAPVALYPYGRIRRVGTPATIGSLYLHEGPLGVFNGTLKDGVTYASLKKADVDYKSTGGWFGITDKYWLVALAPDQHTAIDVSFQHSTESAKDVYLTVYRADKAIALPPGGTANSTVHVFAGAKEVRLLVGYRDQLGLPLFDRAVDFGTYLYILTKPLFYLLDFLYRLIGNFGLAIMALTICVRLLLFPLANKSYRAMNKMKGLQPQVAQLRDRFKDDKQRLNQEMMELYKREKVNPAAGCLPMLVQIPVFICLYKTLYVTTEMRHAPFFGWIKDLSAPDPTSWVNLFGLLPWGVPHDLSMLGPLAGLVAGILALGAWPIIMGFTMFLQQKLNPAPPDPVQAKIFMLLPIVFTFTLAHFAAGLVLYWAWNNLLSVTQQRYLMWQAKKNT